MARLYKNIGKETFALCDKQSEDSKKAIEAEVKALFMHSEIGFEDLVFKNTTQTALQRFAASLEWPAHLKSKYPAPEKDAAAALSDYFAWSKGNWGLADYLAQCTESEIPKWIRDVCTTLKLYCLIPPPPPTVPKQAG